MATRQRVHVYDFADYNRCLQDSLSPDGHTFACFTRNYEDIHARLGNHGSFGWLKLSDLRTGKMLYENSSFYTYQLRDGRPRRHQRAASSLRRLEPGWALLSWPLREPHRWPSTSDRQDGELWATTCRTSMRAAWPLSTATSWPSSATGDTKKAVRATPSRCATPTFPDGNPLNTFNMGRTWMSRVTRGTRLVTGPSSDGAATLFDPASKAMGLSFKLDPVDLSGSIVAAEAPAAEFRWGRWAEAWRLSRCR